MANFNIDYLVVAGGGGGASGYGASGSGGGAGEYLYKTSQTLTTGGSGYTVTVGAGGAGGNTIQSTAKGEQGEDSVFIQTTRGGGFARPAGGSPSSGATYGNAGGSGGGGCLGSSPGQSTAVSPGLGFAGGGGTSGANYGAGGGGGAGGYGQQGTNQFSTNVGGNGGIGLQNPITVASGSGPYYAAGGGGGIYNQSSGAGIGGSGIGGSSYNNQNATAGSPNTGSGGGGGCYTQGLTAYLGGAGSSGVVILRYPNSYVINTSQIGSDLSLTTSNSVSGYLITTIICANSATTGTGTITFSAASSPPFSGTRVTNPVTGFESSVEIGLKIPSGNNSNQPTGAQGMIRNNTSRNTGGSVTAIEHFNGTAWKYFAATQSYPTNLKMFLNASDTNSYPGTGTTWFDLTYNGYDGTISNSNWNSTGYFPFNGSSSIVRSTALGAAFSSQTTLSIAGWFQISASTARMTIASFSNTLVGSTDLWIGFNANGNTIAFRNAVQGASGFLQMDNSGGSNLRDGNWHQVVFTADSGGNHVYVDGLELTGMNYTYGSSSTNIQMPSINQFSIGANQDSSASGGQWFLNGNISKVNVYDTALTSTEVNTLFLEGKGF